jgi:choice-of-anchor B domain-containing protein
MLPVQRVTKRAAAVFCLATLACGGSDSPVAPQTPTGSAPLPPQSADALNMQLLGRLTLAQMTQGVGSAMNVYTGAGNWGYTAPDGRRFALTGTSIGLSVDEVSDPTRPRHVAIIEGPESAWREVKTYGAFAYVTTEATHGLDVIDLRDPNRPTKVQTWSETFSSAHTVCVDSARGLLFVNGTRDRNRVSTGLRVLSVRDDPARPREVGSFTNFYIHDCVVRGTTLYAAAINDGILGVLDIADPARIFEVTRFSTGRRFTHNAWPTVDGRFLFTTDERPDAPVEAWNITDPARATKVAEYLGRPGTIPHNVLVDGNRLVIAHYTDGVHVLDISDPTRLRAVGRYDTFTAESPGQYFNGVWGVYIFPGSNLILGSDMANGLHNLNYTRP